MEGLGEWFPISRQETVIVLVAGILTAVLVGVSGIWNHDRISVDLAPTVTGQDIWEQPRMLDKNGCLTIVLFEDGSKRCSEVAG